MLVVRTPFRLPLGGGGTDLPAYYRKHKGFLVTAAIDKFMYLNINQPALVDKIIIKYSRVEIIQPEQISRIKHDVVRESLKFLKIKSPLEISSMADLAAGTGMGSSSAYAVGLLNGLNTLMRRDITRQELAEEACKVEIELCKKPIGKQDQYAAAFGGIIVMEIDNDGKVRVSPLRLKQETVYELERRLMMFYTGIQRDANTILAQQSQNARAGEAKTLRAMHRIKEIGKESCAALKNSDISAFGSLLHEHWEEKKRISLKMSDSRIEKWYDCAMQNGALGGKLMGAGGGGFLLFCVEEGRHEEFREAMEAKGLRYMHFKFDFGGSKVLADFSNNLWNVFLR